MNKAKISEIFISHQGEGPYLGSKQLFIRVHGCNRGCMFCDTKMESYKTFTKDSLMGKVLDFSDNYNELVLTGGEPLLYADFFVVFLATYKNLIMKPVYLETNGTIPDGLDKVRDFVDIIAMDFKLPSSTGEEQVWREHEEFLKMARGKELIIKAVITDETDMGDIKCMAKMVKMTKDYPEVVLQPVTPEDGSINESDPEMTMFFSKYLEQELGNKVMVLGQAHKCLGIR